MRGSRLILVAVAALLAMSAAPLGLRHDADLEKHDALFKTPEFRAVGQVFAGKEGIGTGTLIRLNCVLTAAHVLDAITESGKPGAVEFNGRKYAVKRMVSHPKHLTIEQLQGGADFGKEVDLGLLFLAEPVEGIKPLSLYRGAKEQGREFVAVGAGAYGVGSDVIRADRMKMQWAAGMNVIDGIGAESAAKHHMPETAMLADFDSPKKPELSRMGDSVPLPLEACGSGGDSGGPWLIREGEQWVVAGVFITCSVDISGDLLGDGLYGSVMAAMRVSQYVDWIESEAR